MKRGILLLITIFALSVSAKTNTSVTIGFVPGENPEILKKNGVILLKHLQKKVGVPMKLHISKDYEGMIKAMEEKRVDYAFFTALSFVYAEKRAGAKVLMKKIWQGPFYHSVILSDPNIKAKSIRDLKGKKIGFVDKKSTSGFLYPSFAIRQAGLNMNDFESVEFFGNHQAAVEALRDGKVQAIGTFADEEDGSVNAWGKYAGKSEDKVDKLWVSEPIPNDPFCVQKDFYSRNPELTHNIMFALTELVDDPLAGNVLKKTLGVKEMKMATSRQYDPVRELVKSMNMILL